MSKQPKVFNTKSGACKVRTWTQDGHCHTYEMEQFQRMRQLNAEHLELRHELTEKREWERRHLRSRDMPNSRESRLDFSDNGKAEAQMVAAIDGPRPKRVMSESERNRAIIQAAVFVAHTLGHAYGSPEYAEVLSIISAVALYGREAREELMRRFNLGYKNYCKRLNTFTRILEKRGQNEGGGKKS